MKGACKEYSLGAPWSGRRIKGGKFPLVGSQTLHKRLEPCRQFIPPTNGLTGESLTSLE